MFDLKHLQAFVVLADRMHFGRAAKLLGISQSTLSTQLRRSSEERLSTARTERWR